MSKDDDDGPFPYVVFYVLEVPAYPFSNLKKEVVKCAVGMWIPDDLYGYWMIGSVSSLIHDTRDKIAKLHSEYTGFYEWLVSNKDDLTVLQTFHDDYLFWELEPAEASREALTVALVLVGDELTEDEMFEVEEDVLKAITDLTDGLRFSSLTAAITHFRVDSPGLTW